MINIAVVSYATGGIAFLVLALVLLSGRRGRTGKDLFAFAAFTNSLWALLGAYWAGSERHLLPFQLLEWVRDLAWVVALLHLLSSAYAPEIARRRFRTGTLLASLTAGILATITVLDARQGPLPLIAGVVDPLLAGHLTMAVVVLVLIEQLYRNLRSDDRRALKYLCCAISGMYAYDFYLYANAMLLTRVDGGLWTAGGFINALVVPVFAIGLMRHPRFSQDIFISRRIVLHTTTLLGAGLYLLAMGFGGYYVRERGGEWGTVAQTIFLFGATLMLALLLFSGQLRARMRVAISKHFFQYKYDYREEWLRFTQTLSGGAEEGHLRERVLRALAQLVESPGGSLWLLREHRRYEPAARWNITDDLPAGEPADGSLARFLDKTRWVVDLIEYQAEPEFYQGLLLPVWLARLPRAWLIVPLMLHDDLLGFVVLSRSPLRRKLNWEDHDLLKTAGRHAASHLAQFENAQLLADARQFEACNRLSAFVVHDLKNLIAQLSLLVANSAKHMHKPGFMEDAVRTVDHSVAKMNKLLAQLRSGVAVSDGQAPVPLAAMLEEVVRGKSARKPVPVLELLDEDVLVRADRERFVMVFGHVVQNAQDATPTEGRITVRYRRDGESALIEVEDNGCGMDESFVRERLFRPFDTTKGAAGMGIGAYETRETVRGMGGDVEVESTPGSGTTFRIRLPVVGSARNVAGSIARIG